MFSHVACGCVAVPLHVDSILENANTFKLQLTREAAMAKDYIEITQNISSKLKTLRQDIPDTLQGFSAMAKAACKDGVLDKKTKELIALALGVAAHCDACIGFHIEALVRLGVTRAEIEETLGMAVYMGGGPSLMYAAEAMAAYEQFSEQKTA